MQLWGGRFGGETDDLMRRFNDSYPVDWRLWQQDIAGSIAYAGALAGAGLISSTERDQIVAGLEQVRLEFGAGTFEAQPTDEDIHTAVERRLTELIGSVAGKLHTGRSRNDQVALDVRLWLVDALAEVDAALVALQRALIAQAETHIDLILPGYTHLQPAQPVLFSHWLMSTFWPIERDRSRLASCAERASRSPLGAGALAGNPFAVDRAALAEALLLDGVTPNSLDAVADRDHLAEFLFSAALIGLHLSRLAEDLIIYASPPYGFVTLDERYTTGSSLMPQKRNPDSLELARGKSGRLVGNLSALLTVLKGLPSTYNKDLQEDKEPAFDSFDTLLIVLPVVTGVIATLTPNPDAMRDALDPAMMATDLADYLVAKGMPFRQAHGVVGKLVRASEERGVPLADLPLDVMQAESDLIESDVSTVFDFERSVARRRVTGGTAPDAVREQIAQAKHLLGASR